MKYTEAVNLHLEKGLLEPLGKGLFLVKSTFRWYIDYDTKNEYIEVKEGFITNFGSIPKILKPFFDPTEYIAYIFHDYLYSKDAKIYVVDPAKVSEVSRKILGNLKQTIVFTNFFYVWYTPTREVADKILSLGIEVEGGESKKIFCIYWALRFFGWRNWRKS